MQELKNENTFSSSWPYVVSIHSFLHFLYQLFYSLSCLWFLMMLGKSTQVTVDHNNNNNNNTVCLFLGICTLLISRLVICISLSWLLMSRHHTCFSYTLFFSDINTYRSSSFIKLLFWRSVWSPFLLFNSLVVLLQNSLSLFLSPVIFIFFSVSWIDNCTNSFRTSSLFFFSILLLPRLLTHSRHPVSQSFTLTIITTRVSVNSTKEPLTSFPCPQKHHVLESPRFRLFLLAIHPDFCPLPDQRIHTISVRSSCWSMWFLESWERAWSAIDACAICSIYSYCLWKALSSRREDSQ